MGDSQADDHANATPQAPGPTRSLTTAATLGATLSMDGEDAASPTAAGRLRLLSGDVQGLQVGEAFDLSGLADDSVWVGRGADCALRLKTPRASTRHA